MPLIRWDGGVAGRRARREQQQRLAQARQQEALEQTRKQEAVLAATLLDDEGTLTMMMALGNADHDGGAGAASSEPSSVATLQKAVPPCDAPSEADTARQKLWVLKPSTGIPIDLTDSDHGLAATLAPQ